MNNSFKMHSYLVSVIDSILCKYQICQTPFDLDLILITRAPSTLEELQTP